MIHSLHLVIPDLDLNQIEIIVYVQRGAQNTSVAHRQLHRGPRSVADGPLPFDEKVVHLGVRQLGDAFKLVLDVNLSTRAI